MKGRDQLPSLVAALLMVLGCQTPYVDVREGPAPGVKVGSGYAPHATVRMNSVNIIDDSLQQWHGREHSKYSKIAVESAGARRTRTGTVEVWALLRNRTDWPLYVEGRTTFFDQDQRPLGQPSGWSRVELPPNASGTYREYSASSHEVAHYVVDIRESR